MEGQNQAQQSEQTGSPIPEECAICLETLPYPLGELVDSCSHCKKVYHKSCITMWLVPRHNDNLSTTCPNCRGDMSNKLLQIVVSSLLMCCVCQKSLEPDVSSSLCGTCKRMFHANPHPEDMPELNNQPEGIGCYGCTKGRIWCPNDPVIQPAEQNFNIDNFALDWKFEDDTD